MMKKIFADSCYWVALANPKDNLNRKAKGFSEILKFCRVFTSDEVLSEFLDYFSNKGKDARQMACEMARNVLNHPHIIVFQQTRDDFLEGFRLYEQRPDKEYSLIDCISMIMMRKNEISEILTADSDFTKEGFIILL